MKCWRGFPMIVTLLGVLALPPEAAPSAQEPELRLAGEFLIPPKTSFPALGSAPFGAISGLATLPGGCELLGVSDDDSPRLYRLRVSGAGRDLKVRPTQQISLKPATGVPPTLDLEGIAITKAGTVLVSSEGAGASEPRLPPAILEYTQDGRFIRQLPVPPRFVPNARGPLRTGVRRNGGFESLTLTPDFARLFTANEIPLVQDGPDAPYSAGQRVRIAEFASDGKSYGPAREFAYELAPLEQPTFVAGFTVNGLVELLAISNTELLALERGFIQARGARFGLNRIRLFRVSLEGATDVSTVESLDKRDVQPVRKTLVQDFSQLAGRSLRLVNLENFEGLAWVGPGQGRDRSLLAVSDDNFNALQVTAFLLLELGGPSRAPACPA